MFANLSHCSKPNKQNGHSFVHPRFAFARFLFTSQPISNPCKTKTAQNQSNYHITWALDEKLLKKNLTADATVVV